MTDRAARATAAVVAIFVVLGALVSEQPAAVSLPVGVGVLGLVAFLARHDAAGWWLGSGVLVAAAGIAVLGHEQSSNLGWFGVCVLAGWMALATPLREAAVPVAGLVAIVFGQWLNNPDEPGWWAWITGTAFTAAGLLLVRRQRQLVDQLREAQAGLADRARVEERNRIAAEIHDVIGHALTVSLLHVSSARLALDEDPQEARASLAEAERLTRQSLAEVRAAVGLVRDTWSDVAPMPGVADVAELVESFRRAGSSVALAVDGDLTSIGATRGLAVYRIVQESLTNAARHAAGAPVSVWIASDGAVTTVTVTSAGTPTSTAEEGIGVLGMRERAEALGGRLRAGPRGSGWLVEAVLPS